MSEFKRENRYIVMKRSDLEKVPTSYRGALVNPMLVLLDHLPKREFLVIESDWPEYEPVWKMLQHRVAGEPSEFDRVTAERDSQITALKAGIEYAVRKCQELQALLTAADEENDALKGLAVKQAALLDELGIPLDEVDDLFGETLKNAKRYEYVRSVMAVENFPAPHPAWSEPSEVESKRIDDLCDAALKPAEGGGDE